MRYSSESAISFSPLNQNPSPVDLELLKTSGCVTIVPLYSNVVQAFEHLSKISKSSLFINPDCSIHAVNGKLVSDNLKMLVYSIGRHLYFETISTNLKEVI